LIGFVIVRWFARRLRADLVQDRAPGLNARRQRIMVGLDRVARGGLFVREDELHRVNRHGAGLLARRQV
jgi:hypothetical protein